MSKNKIAILFIILIFIAGFGYIIFKYRDQVGRLAQSVPGVQKKSIEIKDKKITDNTKPFVIDVTYPEISGESDLNKKIEDFITTQITDFKKISLDNDRVVKEADPTSYAKYPREYSFNVSYTKGEVDEDVISIVFSTYSFTGGAHGAEIFTPFNYNIKTQKEIKLSDLFSNQPDYLQKISDYCIKDLSEQITKRLEDNGDWVKQNQSWINEGAGPKEENYSVFLINKDNLVFYFQEYQVVFYAAGSFQVTMPR
jgi:hypothetical protein